MFSKFKFKSRLLSNVSGVVDISELSKFNDEFKSPDSEGTSSKFSSRFIVSSKLETLFIFNIFIF